MDFLIEWINDETMESYSEYVVPVIHDIQENESMILEVFKTIKDVNKKYLGREFVVCFAVGDLDNYLELLLEIFQGYKDYYWFSLLDPLDKSRLAFIRFSDFPCLGLSDYLALEDMSNEQ